jgi:hypothetical protein
MAKENSSISKGRIILASAVTIFSIAIIIE